jgi:malate dehydrogenase
MRTVPKISIIGAGNVGGMTAMRIAQEDLGEVALIDIAKGLAKAKACDMDDSRQVLGNGFRITGSEDMSALSGSEVVVVTAGLARRPGMTREDLLAKNAQILKEVCSAVKAHASQAILVVVTNPLDIMTRYALSVTGFPRERVIGMGLSLDASRFANLIAGELSVPVTSVDPCVIGSHGEGMMPLPRFTTVNGKPLSKLVSPEKAQELVARTVSRGAEIVGLYGSGSAYFAPSASSACLVRAILKDEKRTIGVSCFLQGEYGIKDTCIGVPCVIGRKGIEKVVALDLDAQESAALQSSAGKLAAQCVSLTAA